MQTKFQLKYSSIYLPILRIYLWLSLFINIRMVHQFIRRKRKEQRREKELNESKTLDQCRPLNSS